MHRRSEGSTWVRSMRDQYNRCVVQYVRGTNVQNAGVTNVVNIQDSKERAPCATYWFLGLLQVPYEAPMYIVVGLPKDR
eukprot:6517741-Pyramimonas_sp.AAC.1